MEYILDVPQKRNVSGPRQAAEELGEDAVEADAVSEATKNIARARYQRLFWEPVVDGKVDFIALLVACGILTYPPGACNG